MEGGGKIIMIPFKCVICEGMGKVPGGFYDGNPNPVLAREECKACGGTGILWGFSYEPIPDSTPWINPVVPWVNPGDTTSPPYEITGGIDNIGLGIGYSMRSVS